MVSWPVAVHLEHRAGQRVFRLLPRIGKAWVAPGAGSNVARIGRSAPGLLVGDHRAIWRAVAVDAGFPANFPIDFVAAPECQVDAGVPRRLDIGSLFRRPVFVVPDGEEGIVVEEQAAAPRRVDAGDVGDVVAVLLEPADRRMLDAEYEVVRPADRARVGDDRAVVADSRGAADRSSCAQPQLGGI